MTASSSSPQSSRPVQTPGLPSRKPARRHTVQTSGASAVPCGNSHDAVPLQLVCFGNSGGRGCAASAVQKRWLERPALQTSPLSTVACPASPACLGLRHRPPAGPCMGMQSRQKFSSAFLAARLLFPAKARLRGALRITHVTTRLALT